MPRSNISRIISIVLMFSEAQRQRSPSAHFVRRRGGTPCWIPFSSAVPGFALPNRFRAVRDLCFTVVEGPLCARLPIYFLYPTSAFMLRRALAPIAWNALLAAFCFSSYPGNTEIDDRTVEYSAEEGGNRHPHLFPIGIRFL